MFLHWKKKMKLNGVWCGFDIGILDSKNENESLSIFLNSEIGIKTKLIRLNPIIILIETHTS
jgi:hypothetical protein